MTIAVQRLGIPCQPRNLSHPHLSFCSPQLKITTFNYLSSPHNLLTKGCLSMSSIKRPICLSVICMARRYGSNTRKRKIKSRRKGGDPEKKKKRRRKIPSKKDKVKIIRLVSATGYEYAKRKGKKMNEKLEIKKHDPNVKRHAVFKEAK